jgi:hypothetical protein
MAKSLFWLSEETWKALSPHLPRGFRADARKRRRRRHGASRRGRKTKAPAGGQGQDHLEPRARDAAPPKPLRRVAQLVGDRQILR